MGGIGLRETIPRAAESHRDRPHKDCACVSHDPFQQRTGDRRSRAARTSDCEKDKAHVVSEEEKAAHFGAAEVVGSIYGCFD